MTAEMKLYVRVTLNARQRDVVHVLESRSKKTLCGRVLRRWQLVSALALPKRECKTCSRAERVS